MEVGEINPRLVKWFKTRGIKEETLKLTGIYSGRHQSNGDSFTVEPDPTGEIIVFPYLCNGEEVNAKYRATGKKFYQKYGGYKTFWNCDVLDEPCLKDGSVSLIITEGEMDALAVIECGIPYVVSVPDGAPPPVVNARQDEAIEPEHDTKYGYIFNNWDALKPIRTIIIATDNDEPGRRLADELVRRLGRVRCRFVSYPVGCKDFNEVLLQHGADEVNQVLRYAQPYPLSGVYTFAELPPEPALNPLSTGWGRLDQYLKPSIPAFMVVTGTAGAGKSTWVNQMVAQMSIEHNISIAIASFEMRINPFISDSLLQVYRYKKGDNGAESWLENNFAFIAPEPTKESDQYDVDWLIERATMAVIRYGIRILVIDPWNEIEHAHRKFESQTEYIGRSIKALKRFGREFEVLVILVAHPSKSGASKAPADITLYDISDSANFANKADFGVVIAQTPGSYETNVMITKVRHRPATGNLGMLTLTFIPEKGMFGE